MVWINFTQADSATQRVNACGGLSLMEAAVSHGIEGIEAACGGSRSCGTCHVYIDDAWLAVVGAPGKDENDLLAESGVQRPNSRLSCQISVSEALAEMKVTVPPPSA